MAKNTAVAPISLADFAKGCCSFVTKSTTFSIDEFISSVIKIITKVTIRINLYISSNGIIYIIGKNKVAKASSILKEVSYFIA